MYNKNTHIRTCPFDSIAAERFPPLKIVVATSTNLKVCTKLSVSIYTTGFATTDQNVTTEIHFINSLATPKHYPYTVTNSLPLTYPPSYTYVALVISQALFTSLSKSN